MLPPIADKHFKRGEKAAREKTSPHKLHRFRIATKKFRYTLDLFAPLYGDSINPLAGGLKDIQSLLGDINDFETVSRMLSGTLSDMTPGDPSQAEDARSMIAAIEKMQREKAAGFRAHWGQTFTPSNVRDWSAALQQVAE